MRATAASDTAEQSQLGALFDLDEPELARPALPPPSIPQQRTNGGWHTQRPLIATGVVIVLVLATSAVWGWSFYRDAPARAALDGTHHQLVVSLEGLAGAASLDELNESATALGDLTGELASTRSDVAGGSELSAATRTLLERSENLATAGSALATVTSDDFSTWADVRADLIEAEEGYESAWRGLRAVDAERAQVAALPTELVSSVEAVVGGAMLEASGESFAQLFSSLDSAATTADLRAVGGDAESMGAGVGAVLDGFGSTTDEHEQLSAYVDLASALAGLGVIDAGHLEDWSAVRSQITQALAPADAATGSLTGAANGALSHVDDLVASAQERLRAWRVDYEAAAEAKRDTISELETYRDGMTTQLDRYGELRGSLSDWIDRVEDPANDVTYDEGYDVLWRAEMDRQEVRDAMSKLSVPAELSTPHNELVSVVDDGIAAVAAAYQGTIDAEFCTSSCYYEDTPGWQRFRSESSRITEDFDVAVEEWEAQMAEAEAVADNTRLPKQPTV